MNDIHTMIKNTQNKLRRNRDYGQNHEGYMSEACQEQDLQPNIYTEQGSYTYTSHCERSNNCMDELPPLSPPQETKRVHSFICDSTKLLNDKKFPV